jgi:hypothetical protein
VKEFPDIGARRLGAGKVSDHASDYLNQRKIRSFTDLENLYQRNDTIVALCGGGSDSGYLLARPGSQRMESR